MGFYTFILGFCAVLISALGAGFSVYGLASLFSGAFMAVAVMSGALELGKLVIASYLHQYWKRLPLLLKTYLTAAVCTLMGITSMGIFGFLSNSYQISSLDINRIQIQIESNETEHKRANDELARMYKVIDEIPADQATKKLMMQKRYESLIADFTKKSNDALNNLNNLKLEQLKTHSKVGPLIYVAKAFGTNIDTVVKWLILVFVCVFDPLVVCLVIATGTALRFNREDKLASKNSPSEGGGEPKPEEPTSENMAAMSGLSVLEPEKKSA